MTNPDERVDSNEPDKPSKPSKPNKHDKLSKPNEHGGNETNGRELRGMGQCREERTRGETNGREPLT